MTKYPYGGNTPIVRFVDVECSQCAETFQAPKGTHWPVACPDCTADAAPASWLRAEGLKPHRREHLIDSRIRSPHHQPNGDEIRLAAEGLAREIQNDVMASESEVADAIEIQMRRVFQNLAREWGAQRRKCPHGGIVGVCLRCDLGDAGETK